ncbi:histidine phosphatase family protein [Aspergillus saccharolyticus JOP 1030-1]|uniref:Phytase A n=1 Tax=Aspergillus saccharolyticus JOP 1030-1 TaxID=1450539 RepID=A0A318ZIE0_9EURO|nr:phytase [Aspergillus saccharolyticus JOP 1030-1]PYH47326.1 phytase [Aspergillus saccharolyticus JOP 1030-1]
MVVISTLLSLYLLSGASAGPVARSSKQNASACDSVNQGYNCFSEISHLWGQYSPYFSVEEESASSAIPEGCHVTFAQVLSRHGARYPTASKSAKYAKVIAKIQADATAYKGNAAFLKTYNYTLGSDDLTAFGVQQMVDSGIKFYQRYESLAKEQTPFVRASGSSRVIESGQKFIQGFQNTKLNDSRALPGQLAASINVVISESANANNSLDPGTCTVFENSELGDDVVANFTDIFTPPILKRLEEDLPGVNLTAKEVVYLMDMCSFDTIAQSNPESQLSSFCNLFTHAEWEQYNYLRSLEKYYGYGAGNPLGPSRGIGFTNELIARLTRTPVHDETSTNRTLDSSPATFPLNYTLYADFTHDNGLIPIFFALGLYNGTKPLSKTQVESMEETDGFSAAWTVPFGARAYVEMMQCEAQPEPLVRVLVNDRVVPLHGCAVDKQGRCKRDDFVRGLSFARSGGNWDECFA